jgi:hypothetical protein
MTGLSTTSRSGKRVGCGRGRGWSDAEIAELNFLRAKGLSTKQIAASMGIKVQRVADKIKQIGDGYVPSRGAVYRRCLSCSDIFRSDQFRMCPDCRGRA